LARNPLDILLKKVYSTIIMKHTPTPWVSTVNFKTDCEGNEIVVSAAVWKKGDEQAGSNRTALALVQYNHKENAEYIAKCVNAHDELVAYLKMTLPDPYETCLTNREADYGRKLIAKLEGKNDEN
jgi:hypothetical protein